MSDYYDSLEQHLEYQISEKERLEERLASIRLGYIGLHSDHLPDEVIDTFSQLNAHIQSLSDNIYVLKQKLGCKPLKQLLDGEEGYQAYINHLNAKWIGYTTQVKQVPLEYMTHGVYREPKPVVHYIANVTKSSLAIEPLEYVEYIPIKFQTYKGHRYYLGASEESNTIVWAYVGKARS